MSLLSEIEALLGDDDLGVRREAIYLLYLKAGAAKTELLRQFLNHADPRLQTAVVACLAEHQLLEAHDLLDEDRLETFLVRTDGDAETGRLETAKLLGVLAGEHFGVFLAQLLADESPIVVREAIASAGRRRDANFIPALIDKLADRRFRGAAKPALAAYGPEILPRLQTLLLDPATPNVIRRNVPSVIHRIIHQQSVDLLIVAAGQVPDHQKFAIVRALNKLRQASPRLRFPPAAIADLVVAEARRALLLVEAGMILSRETTDAVDRLCLRAVNERRRDALELVFRLLGLLYPSQDIYGAYLRISSDRREHQINAVEYLSNRLTGAVRGHVLPLIEGHAPAAILELAAPVYRRQVLTPADAHRLMLGSADYWLKACGLYAARRVPFADLRAHLRDAAFDNSAIVRETALAVAAELGY